MHTGRSDGICEWHLMALWGTHYLINETKVATKRENTYLCTQIQILLRYRFYGGNRIPLFHT